MSQALITDFFINRKSNSLKKSSNVISNESIKVDVAPQTCPPDKHTSHHTHPFFQPPRKAKPRSLQTTRALPRFDFEKKAASTTGRPPSTCTHNPPITDSSVGQLPKWTRESPKLQDDETPHIEDESGSLRACAKPGVVLKAEYDVIREAGRQDAAFKSTEDLVGPRAETEESCPKPETEESCPKPETEESCPKPLGHEGSCRASPIPSSDLDLEESPSELEKNVVGQNEMNLKNDLIEFKHSVKEFYCSLDSAASLSVSNLGKEALKPEESGQNEINLKIDCIGKEAKQWVEERASLNELAREDEISIAPDVPFYSSHKKKEILKSKNDGQNELNLKINCINDETSIKETVSFLKEVGMSRILDSSSLCVGEEALKSEEGGQDKTILDLDEAKLVVKEKVSSPEKQAKEEEETGIPDVLLDSLLKESVEPLPFAQPSSATYKHISSLGCDPVSPLKLSLFRKRLEESVDLLCDETLHEDPPTPRKEGANQNSVFKVPLIPKPKPSPSRSPQSPLKTPFLSPVRKRLSLSPSSPKSPTPKSPQSPTMRFARNSPSSSLSRNYSRSFLSKASYSILNSPTGSPKLMSSPSATGSRRLLNSPTGSPKLLSSPSATSSRRLLNSPTGSPKLMSSPSATGSCRLFNSPVSHTPPRSPSSSRSGTSRIRKTLFPPLDHEVPSCSPQRSISPMKRPSSLKASEFQSPKKRNKVAEVQSQLRTCNSLAQLQQRLVNLQGFREDLESIQQSSPVKLSINSASSKLSSTPTKFSSTPTKLHSTTAPLASISSPVLSRKKKSFLDRLNESIEKHKKSPVKSSKPDGTPTKIYYSPTKARIQSVVGELGASEVASSLELPHHYRRLEEMFHATDTVVGLCLDRGEPCSFPRLQASVRTLIHGKFEEGDLGRLRTIFPQAYSFTREKTASGPQLFIVPNFPPGSEVTKLDVKSLLRRRKHFHLNLVSYVAVAHEEFLRQLGQPLILLAKLTHWHPKFPLAEVGDIPSSPLLASSQECASIHEKTFEFCATIPDSANGLSGIPSRILTKVRAREAARAMRIMQRSPEEQRELKLLTGLRKLVPITYNFLLMERKTSMWMEELCRRVSESSEDFGDIGLVEEHLQYLVRVLPHWLRLLPLPGGGQCLKCVEPRGNLPPLEDLLEHLTVVEKTYFT